VSYVAASVVPPGFRADLSRWRQLVSADWLAALLGPGGVAGAAPAGQWQLFEVGCEGRAQFLAGHIAGAHYVDTQEFERPPFWNKLPEAALCNLLQHLGLGPASSVILYGRNTLAAARVAHLLLCAGVDDVRLLDGGLAAWCAAGHALQPGPVRRRQATPDVTTNAGARASSLALAARPGYVLNLAQARALLARTDAALVSIRSRTEWMGETSGYSYIAQRGEIAGARWGHAGQDGDVNSMSSMQDAAGRMKPAALIQAMWAEAGIHPGMQIAFYCGTGWRASLAFFYAWLMGWERISVFDGGWYEWSADPANPVVCRSP
jgi:molybdopterin synthase sulfurtransferase